MFTKRITSCLFFSAAAFYFLAGSGHADLSGFLPESIVYEGKTYTYAPFYSEKDSVVKINLDKDPEEEIFLSFTAIPAGTREREEFYHFWEIFELGENGYEAVKVGKFKGFPADVYFKDLDSDGAYEIFIFTSGYGQYVHLAVFAYRGGEYTEIWQDESICGIKLDLETDPARIRVASSGWGGKATDKEGRQLDWCYAGEPLYAVYVWRTDNFFYDEELSSYKPLRQLR